MRFFPLRRRRFGLLLLTVTTTFLFYYFASILDHSLKDNMDIHDTIGREDVINFSAFKVRKNTRPDKNLNSERTTSTGNTQTQENMSITNKTSIFRFSSNHDQTASKRNTLTPENVDITSEKSVKIKQLDTGLSSYIQTQENSRIANKKLAAQQKLDIGPENVNETIKNSVIYHTLDTGSTNCSVAIYPNQTPVQTPYKIFIYDLPTNFNKDLIKCVEPIVEVDMQHCGYGPMMFEENGVVFTDIWQFTLDIVLHHKLMHSPYRTLNPDEADVFFIPFYEASHCFCKRHMNTTYNGTNLEHAVFQEIQRLGYYKQGKPHVIAIGKIEREERTKSCPLLKQSWAWNMTAIGIESDDKLRHNRHQTFQKQNLLRFITVPYPSYIHFTQDNGGRYRSNIFKHQRRVFVFMAASSRMSNPFRAQILKLMPNKTMSTQSVDEYLKYQHFKNKNFSNTSELLSMWLVTPENPGPHIEGTVRWMRESVFCLQPPGDSPTRKSIYDGILCGCIPVFFQDPHQKVVTYPFQDILDYSKFSVTIPSNATTRFWDILMKYKDDPGKISDLQKNLYDVMPLMQYSFPLDNRPHADAVQMILDQLGRMLGLQV